MKIKNNIIAEKLINWRFICIFVFFIYFQNKLLYFTSYWHSNFLTLNFFNYLYAVVFFFLLVEEHKRIEKTKEFVMVVFFTVWALFVASLENISSVPIWLNFVFLSVIAFSIPFILTDNGKKTLSALIFIPSILLYFVLAVFGLYSFFINTSLAPLTESLPAINLETFVEDGLYIRLSVIRHANQTGAVYSVIFLASLFLFVYLKSKVAKIFIGLIMIVYYCIIALSQSRTSHIAFSFVIALIVACYVTHKIRNDRIITRFIVFVFSGIIVTSIVFVSFSNTLNVLNDVRISLSDRDFSSYPFIATSKEEVDEPLLNTDIATQETNTATVTETPEVNTDLSNSFAAESFEVGRSYAGFFSFSGRTEIWANCLKIFDEHPSAWLHGYSVVTANIMQEVINLTGKFYDHPHSTYLYVLIATGIIGFAIFIMFIVCILFRILDFLIRGNALNNHVVFYAAIVIFIMLTETMEPFLTQFYDSILPVTFMYSCGMICACTKEHSIIKTLKYCLDLLKTRIRAGFINKDFVLRKNK